MTRSVVLFLLTLIYSCFTLPLARAEIRLPRIFTDNMVLQQQMPIAVWGWASAGEQVTVTLADKSALAQAGDDGKWRVDLPAMPADGKTYELVVKSESGESRTLDNVVLGEVWLCSGQSNMNRGTDVRNENRPDIRLFWIDGSTVPKKEDLGDRIAGWVPCTPEGLASAKPAIVRERATPRTQFAEVGYVFGRRIHDELKVPVGLIKAAFGGSQVQSWTPLPGIEREYPFDQRVEKGYVGHTPGLLYQSMIHGIVPLSMRGVVWYQGENNGRDQEYHIHMKQWIESWRKLWNRPDLPIYFVQIAPTSYAGGNMQQLWEAQSWVMHHVPYTGMAVSNDIYLHGPWPAGEVISDEGKLTRSPSNPHPPNKHVVGERAANIALVKTYGQPDRVLYGPMFDSYQIDGDKIAIKFKYAGSGLTTRDGRPPNWFYVAPELPEKERIYDRHHRYRRLAKYQQPADAEIVGKDTVVVHVPETVDDPQVVLFAWDCLAIHNLMNKEGLPAVCFRLELNDEIAKRLSLRDTSE